MIEDYKSIKEVVKKTLDSYPLTRSNDNYLVIKVLEELSYAYFDLAKEVYVIELSKNDIFRELPAFESIRRNR